MSIKNLVDAGPELVPGPTPLLLTWMVYLVHQDEPDGPGNLPGGTYCVCVWEGAVRFLQIWGVSGVFLVVPCCSVFLH